MASDNNNRKIIESLRQAADYLEAHPEIPEIGWGMLCATIRTKDELINAAGAMGSFKKNVDERYYTLRRSFGDRFNLDVSIMRESVCTKRVVWDCPDESLLREFEVLHEAH